MDTHSTRIEDVKEYYGNVLTTNDDLKTSACCLPGSLPQHLQSILKTIHPEIKEKFYGCGSPIPHVLEGMHVLDLGCGSGRDSYSFSKLVGPKGRVVGVDMTESQLEVAKRHLDYQMKEFGYQTPNIEFHQGFIEDLKSLGIEDNSMDVVVSNCVINLSPNKEQVFKEIFRVLKPGGELLFSDVFSDRRVPEALTKDSEVVGECLGGSLYMEDFRRLLARLNCLDYRVLTRSPIVITNPQIEAKIGNIKFSSITVRAFNLAVEDRCEDYGQVATYQGGIPFSENSFELDDHHVFVKNKPMLVCSNTAEMIASTRYQQYFNVVGDTSEHFGLFDCGPESSFPHSSEEVSGACC